MTVEQILTVAFGIPTIVLLTGIFFRMGKMMGNYEALKAEMALIWAEIHRIREKIE